MTFKDKLFALKPALQPVVIEQLGETVYVRPLLSVEMDTYGQGIRDGSIKSVTATLASLATVDADGNRIFTEADVAELEKADGNIVKQLAEAIIEASGLDNEQADDLKNG